MICWILSRGFVALVAACGGNESLPAPLALHVAVVDLPQAQAPNVRLGWDLAIRARDGAPEGLDHLLIFFFNAEIGLKPHLLHSSML